MEHLRQYEEFDQYQVAKVTGVDRNKLRDAQLAFIRANVKRDSFKWDNLK